MLFDPDLLKGMHKDEVFERFFHESSWHHTSKFFNETDFYKLDEDAVCGSFRPMNPTEVAERDAVRRQAIEEEKAVREAMRAAEIEQLDRHRAYREEHGFAPDTVAAFVHEHPECCQERVSRKGNRVLSYIDYFGHEQVCPIDRIGETHLYTTDIPPDEYILMNSRNVDMVVDEIYDELNSTVKSDYHDDFKRYLAVLSEEHHGGTNSLTGIPFDINETMENGGAYYNPERGIVIASFLLEQTSPRIEAYYGYTPYALASLIGKNADVTVDSDVMDIQDILADPSLPRRFDHEGASFDSVEELIASRWSPTGAGWLDMSGHNGPRERHGSARHQADRQRARVVRARLPRR